MIYLTGESHITCLFKAAAVRPSLPDGIKLGAIGTSAKLAEDFFIEYPKRLALRDPQIRLRAKALFGRPAFLNGDADLYGFSLGFHAFRVCQTPIWRQFRPAALTATDTGQPLSDAVIDTIILEDCRYQRAFFQALKERGIPCFVIESPPLQRRLPVMKAGASAAVIRHVFERYRALSSAFMTNLGIDVIDFPPEALAADGFLKTEYEVERREDVRHANQAYGSLMLDRILDYLRIHHPERL